MQQNANRYYRFRFPNSDKWLHVDAYTRRRPIEDARGNRLTGSKPYENDPAVPYHFAHSTSLLEAAVEAGHLRFNVLIGRASEHVFVTRFGQYKSGKKKKIGNREVCGALLQDSFIADSLQITIFYLDHPEFTKHYAPLERLYQTKKTMRMMKKLHDVEIDFTFLDKLIEERKADPRADDAEEDEPPKISKQKLDTAVAKLDDFTRRSQAAKAGWVGLGQEGRQAHAARMKGWWASLTEEQRRIQLEKTIAGKDAM